MQFAEIMGVQMFRLLARQILNSNRKSFIYGQIYFLMSHFVVIMSYDISQ